MSLFPPATHFLVERSGIFLVRFTNCHFLTSLIRFWCLSLHEGVTAIEPSWLVELGRPLCTFSEPLTVPPPRFDSVTGRLFCFVTPKYGPKSWELPTHPITMPKGMMRYQYLAKCLLDGSMFPPMRQLTERLVSPPALLTQKWTQTKVTDLLQALISEQIDTKVKLVEKWRKNKDYLRAQVALWVSPSAHADLKNLWPPVEK